MSSVAIGRRGEKQPKQVKGAEVVSWLPGIVWYLCFIRVRTTPPHLQPPRSFRDEPANAIRMGTTPVTAEATMAATVGRSDNNNKTTPQSLKQRIVIFQLF